jgi:hypothetical protein
MSEQFLNGSEVGTSLEQVRREGVPQQVGVDTLRLEACFRGEPAQDQENAGAGEAAALRVQEELRAMATVEKRAPAREVPA